MQKLIELLNMHCSIKHQRAQQVQELNSMQNNAQIIDDEEMIKAVVYHLDCLNSRVEAIERHLGIETPVT